MRANRRQPGGAGGRARPDPVGAAALRSAPQPGGDGSASELRERRRAARPGGPQGPGASRPKLGGATASGAPSSPSPTLGRRETAKARSVRVVVEPPPLTSPTDHSGPQRGVAVTGPRCRRGSDGGRAIFPSSPPREREPPSKRGTTPGRWHRGAQKPPARSLARWGRGAPLPGGDANTHSAQARHGAGPVPGKEQREVELGHRVPLPTRGTSFRLRICCRSPADPPLPPLPSCSIPPPFTAERWRERPNCRRGSLALTDRGAILTSAASASPWNGALFLPPQPRGQVMALPPITGRPRWQGRGESCSRPLTLRTALRWHPRAYAPYWTSLSCPGGCALLCPSLPRHLQESRGIAYPPRPDMQI